MQRRGQVRKAMLYGFEKLLQNHRHTGADPKKLKLYIDNIDYVVDFAMQHKRKPTDEEFNKYLEDKNGGNQTAENSPAQEGNS